VDGRNAADGAPGSADAGGAGGRAQDGAAAAAGAGNAQADSGEAGGRQAGAADTAGVQGGGGQGDGSQAQPQAAAPAPAPELADFGAVYVDFGALKAENPDCAAWLWIEGLGVSYPVMHSGDDGKYLSAAFDGSRSGGGSLFLDSRNSPGFGDQHSVIYGHNMLDNSMFGGLDEYASQAYYDSNPFIYLFTPSGSFAYRIFAHYVTTLEMDSYRVDFSGGDGIGTYISSLSRHSWLRPGADPLAAYPLGGDPAGGEATGADSVGGGSAGGDPASAEPAGSGSAGADPANGDATGGDPASGVPAAGDPANADSAGGESIVAGPASVAPAIGADPASADSVGADPASGESDGADPAGGDLASAIAPRLLTLSTCVGDDSQRRVVHATLIGRAPPASP
jgi:hypothetical protein